MKKILTLVVTVLISAVGISQNKEANVLLTKYLQLKEALVAGDAKQAVSFATEMQQSIESAAAFNEKKSLAASLKTIAATTDLEKQRTAFSGLSDTMWQMVKNDHGITQTVYYQYCPMKKTYWLSTESAIRNPYYGNKMLSCGSIKETKTP